MTNEMPPVDVVIATIGRPSLEQAMLAGLHQTYGNVRVVVVADGPCPQARRIFGWLAERHDPDGIGRTLYLETPTHHGAGNPVKHWFINSGLASPFMRFCDDDDWIPPRSVEIMMLAMKPGLSLVTCMMCTLTVLPSGRPRYRLSTGALVADHVGCGSSLIRTAAAQGIPLPHAKNADYEFLRAVADRGGVEHLRLPLYWYNGYRCDAHRGYSDG